jgi:hypothetical protein
MRVKNRKPVPGLPRNFYRDSYLRTLDEDQLRDLKMRRSVNLELPPDILRCVRDKVSESLRWCDLKSSFDLVLQRGTRIRQTLKRPHRQQVTV